MDGRGDAPRSSHFSPLCVQPTLNKGFNGGRGSWRDTKDHVYCRVPPSQHLIDWGPSASSLLSSSWCWLRLRAVSRWESVWVWRFYNWSVTDHNSSQFSVLIVLRKCNSAWVCNIDPWSPGPPECPSCQCSRILRCHGLETCGSAPDQRRTGAKLIISSRRC